MGGRWTWPGGVGGDARGHWGRETWGTLTMGLDGLLTGTKHIPVHLALACRLTCKHPDTRGGRQASLARVLQGRLCPPDVPEQVEASGDGKQSGGCLPRGQGTPATGCQGPRGAGTRAG